MTFHDLMERYLAYVGESEAPEVYHRWSFIGCMSAALGRRVWFPMGHFMVYPNLYIMLMGDPGARKSTSIKIPKSLLTKAGFSLFGGSKISAEKFYMELETAGELDLGSVSQQFICADEFSNFIGIGNSSFISGLTELFDASDSFPVKFKNSKSSFITNPCVGVLGGMTHSSFQDCFPPAILHNGFLSRLILVFGQKAGKRIPFPRQLNDSEQNWFVTHVMGLMEMQNGQLAVTPEAKGALEEIYEHWDDLEDGRFITYAQRRYVHLLKLCVVCAASTGKAVVEYADVLYANTLLVSAELYFSRALGEFGKAKNSNEASIVMNALYAAKGPLSYAQLYAKVDTNLEKWEQLRDILSSLMNAGKVVGKEGFYHAQPPKKQNLKHTDFRLLGVSTAQAIQEDLERERGGKQPSDREEFML